MEGWHWAPFTSLMQHCAAVAFQPGLLDTSDAKDPALQVGALHSTTQVPRLGSGPPCCNPHVKLLIPYCQRQP